MKEALREVLQKLLLLAVVYAVLIPLMSRSEVANEAAPQREPEVTVAGMRVSRMLYGFYDLGNPNHRLAVEEAFANHIENGRVALWQTRAPKWQKLIQESAGNHGVPYEPFVALLAQESDFAPRAISPSGARGISQFLPRTARKSGLRIHGKLDERFDPNLAIPAAAQHLKYLYGKYGDWEYAFLAYNTGEPRLNSALEAGGSLEGAIRYLAPESQTYVPGIIAAGLAMRENQKTSRAVADARVR